MKKILKDAFSLFAITLVAGALLAGVYAITKGPIAKAEQEARAQAYSAVFKNAAAFETDDALTAAVKNADEALENAGFGGASLSDALYVKDANGKTVGCVMTLGGNGYGGVINFTLGVTLDGKITGISILAHSETVGLGSKCTDESFYGQFADKPATPTFTVVKGGAGEVDEIDAISGATVTSRAVTEAVNAGVWFAQEYMQVEGGADV